MKEAKDQLPEEVNHPHLVAFLRSGGTLEIGEDFSIGGFARLRKGNTTFVVDAAYRDFATLLKEMDSLARRSGEDELIR